MAELYVKHSLNPYKTVKVNVALREFIVPNEEGERVWVLELGTRARDVAGDKILPVYIHNVSESNIEDEINKAISSICNLIDWTEFEEDVKPPRLVYFKPTGDDVSIDSFIEFKVKEELPAAGIDRSAMTVTLNNGQHDFDITSELEVQGDPYEYVFRWKPPKL